MHESLIAPYDFPIYKTEEQIAAEKDSILQGFRPYFSYNPQVWEELRMRLHDYIGRKYKSYLERNETLKSLPLPAVSAVTDTFLSYFAYVYQKGIVEFPENIVSRTLMIIRNNIAEEVDPRDYYTTKSAYRYLTGKLTAWARSFQGNGTYPLENFLKELHLENYLKPNTTYDAISSENAIQELTRKISLTEGLVQRGERIILTGDIVNERTYLILNSLKKESELRLGKSGNYYLILLGHLIFSAFMVMLLFLYIFHYRKETGRHDIRISFFVSLLLIMSALSAFFLRYQVVSLYLIPFAIVPILINSFYDSRIAFVVHVIIVLLVGFWAPNSFEFVMLNGAAGLTVLLRLSNQFNRNRIFFTALLVVLTYSILFYGKHLIQEAAWKTIDVKYFGYFVVNGLLLLTSIPLIYFFEKIFGFLSDATLLEISDTNQPLLKKLAETAPGTFHHSVQVANLAEEAIRHIGGNTLLVRAGALYHDIGKMKNPQYFIENQVNINNPHDQLEEINSAKIIIEHIEEGVVIAKKYNLPPAVIDFIRSHHGNSPVMHFYKLFLKKYPNDQSSLSYFKYPGPRPRTKEVAVVMLADSVEAASRSLKSYTPQSINNMVEAIVTAYLEKGQLNDANITLKDIEQVKKLFKERLQNIYHLRISYPE